MPLALIRSSALWGEGGSKVARAMTASAEWRQLYEEHCYESRVLACPESFLKYLLNGRGVFTGAELPESAISWSDDEGEDASEEEPSRELLPECLFPDFCSAIERAIRELGGSCLVKLGNTSAKDAIWVTTEHSLRCQTVAEVLELLKSSDRIAWAAGEGGRDKELKQLTLIQWNPKLDPCLEFRCFIGGSGLVVAISQRDDTVYYEHLLGVIQEADFVTHIVTFLSSHLHPALSDRSVVDIYYDHTKNGLIIIDVEPWDPQNVSGILYSADEIENLLCNREPAQEIRLIETEQDCRLSCARYNNYPVDMDLFTKEK